MDKQNIYFDNNGTTRLHPEVVQIIKQSLDIYGNPSSTHHYGREIEKYINNSREQIARLINAEPDEILFTSGGTESNNSVLKLCLQKDFLFSENKPGRIEILTSAIEHPSIIKTVKFIKSQEKECYFLPVDAEGLIDLNVLEEYLKKGCNIVSIMTANNEIGTIQDIKKISQLVHSYEGLFHTDAVQALGKIPIDVKAMGIDYLSLSGHKIYGPKGTGALYVKSGTPFNSYMHGGHQENNLRAGTENTPGIIGFGEAARISERDFVSNQKKLEELSRKLKQGITKSVPDIRFNCPDSNCLVQTLNISFPGALGETIAYHLDKEGIAVSTGSACSSELSSHVLKSIGLSAEIARSSIRISLGIFNTSEEVDYFISAIPNIITRIRSHS